MSREIKFRGKTLKEDFFKGKFVYGNAIICEDEITSTIINDEFEAEVLTDTIGQFTGMKDNIGNDIYDGDYVINGSTEYPYLMEVYWDERFQWSKRLVVNKQFSGRLSNNVDVVPKELRLLIVGNIHENPELASQEFYYIN